MLRDTILYYIVYCVILEASVTYMYDRFNFRLGLVMVFRRASIVIEEWLISMLDGQKDGQTSN